MPTFISLLRGINVAGRRRVRMAQLVEIYEELGLSRVETYLQSGNVIFDSTRRSASRLATSIERELASRLGVSIGVVVRTPAELERIVAENPFSRRRNIDPARVLISFLAGPPPPSALADVVTPDARGDEFALGKQEVYLCCPGGYGRTKLSNNFLERKLKTTATTRNLKTVEALLMMSRKRS